MLRLFGREREGAWIIVGLGNPGGVYQSTRHNVGFMAVDRIAGILGVAIKKDRFRSMVGEGRCEGGKIVLIKPQTYMNLSGDAVRRALRYHRVPPDKLITIYDDVDIPLGKIRVRAFGGTGSHNGMRSIAECLGEDAKFPRIRIGIGQQPRNVGLRDYVLQRFTAPERELADAAVGAAAAAALDIVRIGVERAMSNHNPKK
jgi:PTH1 family peptidyl-tRNA hydrolase